jgi:HK97 gp10 family phage protein
MPSITIDIANFGSVNKRFEKLSQDVKNNIKDEIAASVLKIQSDAKKNAPVNLGTLRNSIYIAEEDKGANQYIFGVGSNASYAAYVEFGTGGKVRIPPGYENYAAQFKGKAGGKFNDMILALMEWGIRKGYITPGKGARQHAYFMALKILKKGLRAQGFLIPAFEAEKPKLIQRIEKIIKNA